ncbi:MAG TPA: 2-oxo-4-hydroxy-4-carboxy-5-ureidoimidazoline decarboxylase [Micromonospora sp.]
MTFLNDLSLDRLLPELLVCCAAPRWARLVAEGRPFGDVTALHAHSDATIAALDWADLLPALTAHPRIGERPVSGGREAAWSRAEQAGAAGADASTAAALVRANVDYEQRFGHVFLICATGRSAEQMLTAARTRLGNDPATEQQCVRRELAAITRLRLTRLVSA